MTHQVENRKARCRFAPSPTGYLHLGGARTALFNYLFAKSVGGTFVLRVEDTDRERSTDEAVDAIFQGLEWLGITADEGPFFQTKRMELYADYAKQLLRLGHAYRCYATAEELTAMREQQTARGEKPRYDGRFRPPAITPQPDSMPPAASGEKPFVIRFRAPQDGATVFHDLVLGDVATPNAELEDFIIVRSDGSPTYNFCVVVDDIDMKISHVVRGSDHVSNTPKQVAIYQALGAALPKFIHVPMILGEDKKKLSKRHGATSVIEYKKDGYLPDAFVNYLVRLGWSHGDQEIFSRGDLEKVFDLEHIGKSAAVFDFQKLRWVNSEHIKTAPFEVIFENLRPFLEERGWSAVKDERTAKLIDSLRERSETLKDMADKCGWFFAADESIAPDEAQKKKAFTDQNRAAYDDFVTRLTELADWSEPALDASLTSVLESHNLGMGKLGPAVRLALTGTTASPPLGALFVTLGKPSSLLRLERGRANFPS